MNEVMVIRSFASILIAFNLAWSRNRSVVLTRGDLRPIARKLTAVMINMGMRPGWCEFGAF